MGRKHALSMAASRIKAASGLTLRAEPKTVDAIYQTPEYRRWREAVIARAGRQCQETDTRTGKRCIKAEPRHRMFADHVIEIRDGGPPFDVTNGRCKCGAHHSRKTALARAARLRAPS